MAKIVKMYGEAKAMKAGFTSTSGGSISIGEAVGVNSSGEICTATILASSYVPAVGVALRTGTKGVWGTTNDHADVPYVNNDCKVYDSTWSWTPGGTVWLLSGTNFTQTCPNANNQMIQKIGHAIDATNIQVTIGDALLISGNALRSGI